MSWDPKEDGITHLNVYSQGRTELGRLLSNFAHTPFFLESEGRFQSVEGYWYWLLTGDDALRSMYGVSAKYQGRNAPLIRTQDPTVQELRKAYAAKLKAHPKIQELLRECKLPLTHYYVYDGRIVEPRGVQWTVALWEDFR